MAPLLFYWWTEGYRETPPECPRCMMAGWYLFFRDGVCSCCHGEEARESVPGGEVRVSPARWLVWVCQFVERLKVRWPHGIHPDFEEHLEKHQPAVSNSEWVGEEKERLELSLVFQSKDGPFEGDYGDSWRYEFLHNGKNRMIWFTKESPIFHNAVKGQEFRVKATIGGHEEWKKVKTTKLKRVKTDE